MLLGSACGSEHPAIGATPARATDRSASHPRIWLTPATKGRLLARKRSGDPSWLKLKARADTLARYSIYPYTDANRSNEPDNTIFYDYQGSGWYDATMPLALAYQMTGDTKYSDKLLQLADEMIAAQTRSENQPPHGVPPLRPDNYYPTRYLGPVIAIIYDWCYDRLGDTRRATMVNLMNAYFDDMRANAYQVNDHADGNYFSGHLLAAAWMGYASAGDNPRAQEMIDYARMRFDGMPSSLVTQTNIPDSHVDQVFDGGYKSAAGIPGAPFKSGFDFQGWAYGTGTFDRILDYLLTVKAATGEDLVTRHRAWLAKILRAEQEALQPDRFEIDPTGDWGSDYGAVIDRSLPARLAFLLAGTPDGPYAQYLVRSGIDNDRCRTFPTCPLSEWEDFFFGDPSRPSSPLRLPIYYTGFGPSYPRAGSTNGALPYFIMRSSFAKDATWASIRMGAAFYDDHQHHDAGQLIIKRGQDYLLVGAGDWKGGLGSRGIYGSSTEADEAAAANTLYFNDFGDSQCSGEEQYAGGQGDWGQDRVIADEQNNAYTYVRSDLSSAYNASDPSGCYGSRLHVRRELASFYRSFVYLPSANLFLLFDQIKAASSTNRHGPYLKHLRWHFPNVPVVRGQTVRVNQGASRLVMDTLLPAKASITPVDERHNPDGCDKTETPCLPCDGTSDGLTTHCTPWGNDSGTYRVEVRAPGNPLAVRFLTVIQAGPKSAPPRAAARITDRDGRMIGARMLEPDGRTFVVLLNNGPGQTPTPLTSTSYTAPRTNAMYLLCGLPPNARYAVSKSRAGIVTVTQFSSGPFMTSAAGVLRFTI